MIDGSRTSLYFTKMKKNTIVFFMILGALLSCGKEENSGGEVSRERVLEETNEALRSGADYLTGKKEDYIRGAEKRLKEINARILQLKKEAEKAEGDVSDRMKEEVKELEKKRDNLNERLNELRNSSENAWKGLAKGLDSSLSTLNDSVKGALEEFQ